MDISSNFKPSPADSEIMLKVAQRGNTKQAIRYFARHAHKLSDYAYWFGLSTLWVSNTDGHGIKEWKNLFSSSRPQKETSLMKPSELKFYNSLPEKIIAYRACNLNEKDWIAYTLDLNTAILFAQINKQFYNNCYV